MKYVMRYLRGIINYKMVYNYGIIYWLASGLKLGYIFTFGGDIISCMSMLQPTMRERDIEIYVYRERERVCLLKTLDFCSQRSLYNSHED